MSDWRKTREYRIWRVTVIRRDKRCVVCGSIKNRHAHHLYHASYYPEKRFDPENGVCLCERCHSYFHNKLIGSTRKKCTAADFSRYLKLALYFMTLEEERE